MFADCLTEYINPKGKKMKKPTLFIIALVFIIGISALTVSADTYYGFCGDDLDLNSSVNSIDAVILARHIAGWEGYETIPLSNGK